MNLRIALMVLLLFCCALIAHAHAKDTQIDIAASGLNFLAVCGETIDKPASQLDESDLLRGGQCYGYVKGVEDGIAFGLAVQNSKGRGSMGDLGICLPTEGTVTLNQMTRLVLKYIKDHTEQAHEPTVKMVARAIKSAFPCGVSAPKRSD
jgi:hypothetical protein